jgi:hypothetical protein
VSIGRAIQGVESGGTVYVSITKGIYKECRRKYSAMSMTGGKFTSYYGGNYYM